MGRHPGHARIIGGGRAGFNRLGSHSLWIGSLLTLTGVFFDLAGQVRLMLVLGPLHWVLQLKRGGRA
jgi:hypothetical protein